MISTDLYFTSITPKKITGTQDTVVLNYATTLSLSNTDYEITEGNEYVKSVNLDTTKNELIVNLDKFVYSDEEEQFYESREIFITIGKDNIIDTAKLIQVKAKPILEVTPTTLSLANNENDTILRYRINDDIHNYSDLYIQPFEISSETEFELGGIDEHGNFYDSNYATRTKTPLKIDVTKSTTIICPELFKFSSSGYNIVAFKNGLPTTKTYDTTFSFNDVTSQTFNYVVNDLKKSLSTSEGQIYDVYISIGDNKHVGSKVYSSTNNNIILSASATPMGTISLKTIPNYTTDDIINYLTIELQDTNEADDSEVLSRPEVLFEESNARASSTTEPLIVDTQTVKIIKSANDDISTIIPKAPTNIVQLDPFPFAVTPTVVGAFKFEMPDNWNIRVINNTDQPFTTEVNEQEKTVYILQNRSNIPPTESTNYELTVQLKPNIVEDPEFIAHEYKCIVHAGESYDTMLSTTDIQVDYLGKESSTIQIENTLKIEKITGIEVISTSGISKNRIITFIDTDGWSGNITLKKLPENLSINEKVMTFKIRLTFGTVTTHEYEITVKQDPNTSYKELSIGQDCFYTIIDDDVYYRLVNLENNDVIYTGKIYPSATKNIKINDIVKDYLSVIDNPFTSVFIDNNAYYNIILQTSSDNKSWNNKLKYYFYYNYSENALENIGLISAVLQPVDYFSPYQYFITTKQNYMMYSGVLNAATLEISKLNEVTNILNIPTQTATMITTSFNCENVKQIRLRYTTSGNTQTYRYNESCVDSDWVLYYVNEYGGWNWMFFDGKNVKGSTSNKSTYLMNNKYTTSYKNDISVTWDLNTKYLTDEQSIKLEQLYKSPIVWMQKLAPNEEPFRVNIDTKNYQIKSFVNQGKKFYIQSVKVTKSDTDEWLR